MADTLVRTNLPGILIDNENREKFRQSVYGKLGHATRSDVRDFVVQLIKDGFANHNVEIVLSSELNGGKDE